MNDPAQDTARPASVDDLKELLRALNAHGVDYFLIGGYALHALGYQRGTTDIDLMLRPTHEQGERVRKALLLLPDKAAADLKPEWFSDRIDRVVLERALIDLKTE